MSSRRKSPLTRWLIPLFVVAGPLGRADDCNEQGYCVENLAAPQRCGPVFFGEAEALFAHYYRTDGVRVGVNTTAAADERVEFDFNISPRVTLGAVAAGGLGFRGQWWEYAHVEDANVPATGGTPPEQRFAVDAYTVDLEFFEAFDLNSNWTVELSGGARHTGFEETMFDNNLLRYNTFFGIGPVVGLEGRRRFLNGQLYGRLQAATLFGDRNRENAEDDPVELQDSLHTQLEIACGYRAQRPLGKRATLTWWAGFESMNWYAVSSSFNNNNGTIDEDEFVGNADVGFASFTFGVSVSR